MGGPEQPAPTNAMQIPNIAKDEKQTFTANPLSSKISQYLFLPLQI